MPSSTKSKFRAPSLPVIPENSNVLPSNASGSTFVPSLEYFKQYPPSNLRRILQYLQTPEAQHAVQGKWSTKNIRTAIKMSERNCPDSESQITRLTNRYDILTYASELVQKRLTELLRMEIPSLQQTILAKRHANLGKRIPSSRRSHH